MKPVFIFCFVLLASGFVFGQDGSDMKYVKPDDVKAAHIGQTMHLDFYRQSRGWFPRRESRNLDKVSLEIDRKRIEFVEHREDDGFNNWFSEHISKLKTRK